MEKEKDKRSDAIENLCLLTNEVRTYALARLSSTQKTSKLSHASSFPTYLEQS